MQTGVTGIAMSGTILRAANPVEETKKIVNQLKMKNEE
jgi:thiamine-phosphate pyrophosphorylase